MDVGFRAAPAAAVSLLLSFGASGGTALDSPRASREWKTSDGRFAAVEEIEDSLGDNYASRLEIDLDRVGKFTFSHKFSSKIGGELVQLTDSRSGWEAKYLMSYELPKGFEIPPNGDFETLDQLQDLPGTTIRHELETSDGLRWEFRESHETLLPEAEEDLDGLVDREMEPRLNRPKLPEGVREVIRLLLLSAERPSDLGYRYRWFCRLLQSLDRVASRSGAQ